MGTCRFHMALTLQCINTALKSRNKLKQAPTGSSRIWAAYRQWADSFGLDSPAHVFFTQGDRNQATTTEVSRDSWAKHLATAEALGALELPTDQVCMYVCIYESFQIPVHQLKQDVLL